MLALLVALKTPRQCAGAPVMVRGACRRFWWAWRAVQGLVAVCPWVSSATSASVGRGFFRAYSTLLDRFRSGWRAMSAFLYLSIGEHGVPYTGDWIQVYRGVNDASGFVLCPVQSAVAGGW